VSLFRLRLLPADHGDCILLEYGDSSAPHRVLVDGGTPATWKPLGTYLRALPEEQRNFELLVVTHVDADHIGGALALFDDSVKGLSFDDIWFNGYRHLTELEDQGPVQGERLTTHLWPRIARWNKAFDGKAVVVESQGELPTKELPGGLQLTLLSPTRAKLAALLPKWEKACAKAGLDPQVEPPPRPEGLEPMGGLDVNGLVASAFVEDTAEANGSSIAFIASYGGRKVLFGADAHPTVLAASIARLPGGTVAIDAFKLSHHGSKHNVSDELLAVVDTTRYLVSTNGSHFKHPDREAIARIVKRRVPGCELRFNYRSDYTAIWDNDRLRREWEFRITFPDGTTDGDVLEL
jgi:hypothetical protein